jgi:hypothetical protein
MCARFRDRLLWGPGAAGNDGLLDRSFVEHSRGSADCLASMFGHLCDDIYRRWAGGLGAAGAWEARLDAAAEAGLDCLEFVPGATGVANAAALSGDARIAGQRTRLRERLSELIAHEYDGPAGDPPELHFEFVLGAIARAIGDGLSAGEPPVLVRKRVRTAIALLEPAAA